MNSATATSSVPALDRSSVEHIRRRFTAINRDRLNRVSQQLSARQQDFLELLPLFFHTNHPLMPGYVGSDVPTGVASYAVTQSAVKRARALVRAFTFQRRALRTLPIQGIYLMGSTGTVGQSSHSDLDIWLCHDPSLDAAEVARLREKADAISAWADSIGLEAHFFPLTASGLREGHIEALSSESSGSTQRHLLLDEFYRTGLLVAGRPPAWWLVPSDREQDYDDCLEYLVQRRLMVRDDYLDFGPVADIGAEEFLGATLWQLFKGISSPHKSVLKILLLESYAAEYPSTELLSVRYKRLIESGEKELDRLDPYVLLLRQIEEYLQALGDEERLHLVRCCFYFKAHIRLGRDSGRGDDYRRKLLRDIVDGWKWDRFQLAELDARADWRIDRVLEEQKVVVNALTTSYRQLSGFARRNAGTSLVSKRDMTILGRKLFTVFEHKAGKIDLVNRGVSTNLAETHLSIHQIKPGGDQAYWLLFRGTVHPGEVDPGAALKRGWTLLEVVAWCHFNGLLMPNTRMLVCASDCDVESRDIESLATFLRERFPRAIARGASFEDLAVRPSLLAAATFVNLDVDPLASYTRRGKQLTSGRMDALSYSGWHENLVRVVDYMIVTSWREIMTFKFHGLEGLLACLCEHLRWIARSPNAAPDTVRAHCFTPGHADTITRRVLTLFDEVTTWFTSPGETQQRRYVLRGGQQFYVLHAADGVVRHDFTGSFAELLRYLGKTPGEYTATTIDPLALSDTPLPEVLQNNRPNVVQFHLLPAGKRATVYVLDEHGALFCDEVPFFSTATLLLHYERFFDSIRLRQNALAPPAPGDVEEPIADGAAELRAQFYLLRSRHDGGYQCQRIDSEHTPDNGRYFSVKVIAETVDGATRFTLYVNGREFSTREYQGRVFNAVARHVISQRRAGQTYPIYITDMDLSRVQNIGEHGRVQTLHYLHYKKRIEERLNQAVMENSNG